MNDKSISKWSISRILRLSGKSLLIFVCFVITLLLISVIVIQFRSVRQFALEKLLNVVTTKTNSIITANDLHFYFNGHVDLDGLFVGDQKGDTILAAGNISFRIGIMELIDGNIHLNNVELTETNVNLVKTDSVFNFTFILDKLSSKEISTDTASTGDSSEFSIDRIRMQDCQFTFLDNTSGTDVFFKLEEMALEIDSLDLVDLKFSLNKLNLSGAVAEVKLNPGNSVIDTSTKAGLPVFIIGKMNMDNFTFSLDNKVDSQKVLYSTLNSEFESINIDLNENYFSLESIVSKNSRLNLVNSSQSNKEVESTTTTNSALHLKVNKISLVNNELKLTSSDLNVDGNKFNPSNFQLKALNGEVSNLIFSTDSLHAEVSGLTTYLDRETEPFRLSGKVSKFQNTIIATGLDFRHGKTELKGKLFAGYDLSDKDNKVMLANSNLDISRAVLNHNDLIYFVSDSIEKKYFAKPWPAIEFAVKANGNSEKMVISRFDLIAGNSTSIESNFTLTNIDKPEIMGFDIPNFSLRTSRKDLESIPIPGLLPNTLNIPESISVRTSGKGTKQNFKLKTDVRTSTGNLNLILAKTDSNVFVGDLKVVEFNVGRLLKMEDQVGPVSLQLDFKGSGTSTADVNASINLAASSFVYNKYNYHDLTIVGNIAGKTFSGIVELNDTNAELKIDGLVDLNEGREKIKTLVDIQGINLKKLNFTTDDIRFSSNATIDFNGLKYDSLTGNLAVHNIVIVKNENIYRLDSLLLASVNDSLGNNTKMESAILTADFRGAFSPANLISEIRNLTNRYFPVSDTIVTGNKNDFSFNIYLRNHPVLKDVFLPKLEEFSTIEMKGNFDKKEDVFNATLTLPYLKYAGMKLENFVFDLKSDSVALVGNMGFKELSNVQFKVDSLNVNVLLRDSTMKLSLLNLNGEEKKLSFSTDVIANSAKDYLLLLPGSFILNSEEWLADGSDSIHLRKDLPVTVNMDISKKDEHILIERDINGNGKVIFNGFQIENIFQLVSRDSTLASGVLNGDIVLADKSLSGIINLQDIVVKKYPIGDIYIKANQLPDGFAFTSKLEGNDNIIGVSGDITTVNEVSVLNIIADLQSISMKSIEALSMGNLSSSAGNISGKIKVSGTSSEPDLEGKLVFNNVETVPTSINSRFSIPNSTLAVENKKLLFNKFAMRDSEGKDLIVDGFIDVSNMTNPDLSISITSEEFELFNSPKAQKKMFYGRMIADSKIDITGSLGQPFIKAKLGVRKGTDFTFAIPKSSGQSDRGGEEVVFKLDKLNTILISGNQTEIGKSDFRNVTVEALLEIDKGAVLRILPDPDSGDSLIVQGAAALNFGLDRTGRMSLTGSYELEDGSYVVSLENLVKKRFKIQQGSRIDWNGDPLNAEIDLRAMYEVRTSPADLLANEFSGNSSADNEYKERLPFQVFLYLKGDLKAPVISFEIQLPAGSRGALGGMVNEKLLLLNNDPSELNKQVFALLVLNRFIQEDPLASSGEGSAAENAARSSVSRFLSNQLNKLSSQYISGVELNFDLQSYNDYGSNSGEGRTELAVGIKKNINDRISVQVGGSVEVEGARAKENSLSDWTGDFIVEYKLTEDGEYRLKGFRRNQYEGLVEGQLVETGIGLLFVKDFDLWKDLFKKNSVKEKGYESPDDK
jgi:translocation and assembly module TamB